MINTSSAPSAAASRSPRSRIWASGWLTDLAFDRGDDESADRDGLADRADAVALGADQDHEIFDEAVEAVRLVLHVRSQRTPSIRGEILRCQQLGAAVDGGDRRAELVRQDVEKGLAIALADQPALRRCPGGSGSSWDFSGLPADADGSIPVDLHCRVIGVRDVFAAGDSTVGRIKQGGLAAQQADAAAEMIAAAAGAPVTPRPCRRVLRGILETGEAPLHLRRDLDGPHRGAPDDVSRTPLWWPTGKLAGDYLAGFTAAGEESGDTLSDRPSRPVLAQPSTEGTTMNTILIGVDASARSEDAIAFGNHLAGVSNAHVVVACAFPYNDAPAARPTRPTARRSPTRPNRPPARCATGSTGRRGAHCGSGSRPTHRPRTPSTTSPKPSMPSSSSSAPRIPATSGASRRAAPASGYCTARLRRRLVPHGYRTRGEQPIRRIGVAYDGSDEASRRPRRGDRVGPRPRRRARDHRRRRPRELRRLRHDGRSARSRSRTSSAPSRKASTPSSPGSRPTSPPRACDSRATRPTSSASAAQSST